MKTLHTSNLDDVIKYLKDYNVPDSEKVKAILYRLSTEFTNIEEDKENIDIIKYLINNTSIGNIDKPIKLTHTNIYKHTLLHILCDKCDTDKLSGEWPYEIAELLIKKGAQLNFNDTISPLSLVKNVKLAKLLLKNGANLNIIYDDKVPIMYMSKVEMIKLYVDNGADVSFITSDILINFIDNQEEMTKLLYYCISINKIKEILTTSTYVHYIFYTSDQVLLKILIENYNYLNVRDTRGNTPLNFLCSFRARVIRNDVNETILFLIENGTNIIKIGDLINTKNNEGEIPLATRDLDIFRVLINCPDIDLFARYERTTYYNHLEEMYHNYLNNHSHGYAEKYIENCAKKWEILNEVIPSKSKSSKKLGI